MESYRRALVHGFLRDPFGIRSVADHHADGPRVAKSRGNGTSCRPSARKTPAATFDASSRVYRARSTAIAADSGTPRSIARVRFQPPSVGAPATPESLDPNTMTGARPARNSAGPVPSRSLAPRADVQAHEQQARRHEEACPPACGDEGHGKSGRSFEWLVSRRIRRVLTKSFAWPAARSSRMPGSAASRGHGARGRWLAQTSSGIRRSDRRGRITCRNSSHGST